MDSKIDTPLAREEWDFSKCPDDRLYFCFTYEYAREILALVAQFHHDEQHDPSAFDLYGQWHHVFWRPDPKGDDGWPEVIDAPLGFPEKPYLLTRHYLSDDSRRPVTPRGLPLRPVAINPDHTYQVDIPGQGEEVRPDQLSVFQIDWLSSDKPIIDAFTRWLLDARKGREDRKPLERRGLNEISQCRTDLEALGAFRLIRYFQSQPAASQYTEGLGRTGNRRLFSEPSRWYKAKARAEEIIADWSKAAAG